MTPEMQSWLATNRQFYEFNLLHALLHNVTSRLQLVPSTKETDFSSDAHGLIFAGLVRAISIHRRIGAELPFPPPVDTLLTHMKVANIELGVDDETVKQAEKVVRDLMDPQHEEMRYFVLPYYSGWAMSARAKREGKVASMSPVADARLMISRLQSDLRQTESAADVDVDEMEEAYTSVSREQVRRISTGIPPLDFALGGGMAPGECSLIFSGTGGGKTVLASQLAWHGALTNESPLIFSTEVRVIKYICRIVSNAASVPIHLLVNCTNILQIREVVSSNLPGKLDKVDQTLDVIRRKIWIYKGDPDQALMAGDVLEIQTSRFADKYGHLPKFVVLDWLGTMADVHAGQKNNDRIVAWEYSANSCVAFADRTNISTLVLAQAVNNSQALSILTIGEIGISKGIAKNMVNAVGITNTIDRAGIAAHLRGEGEAPTKQTPDEQLFCVAKSREGEGTVIPVVREFAYQRFRPAR